MTFYSWITRNYKTQEGAKGELARFLKGNGQAAGTESYGLMVELLLAEYRK